MNISYLWALICDPSTDPVLLRVCRWLMQWPEAAMAVTMIDPQEIAYATGFSREAVDGALREMVARQFIHVHAERPDGVMWWTIHFGVYVPPTDIPQRPRGLPKEKRRDVPLGLRWKILERDGRKCRACGATAEDGAKLVIDHVKPFSKGGLTTESNLQVLCHDCNSGKIDRWLELA